MKPLGMISSPRLLSAVWMSLVASVLLAGPVNADDREVSSASGESTIIGRHALWKSKDCGPNGMPAVKISQQAEHGAANLTAGPITIGSNRTNPGQDQCRGKEVTGVILNYLSKPDFVGTDTVTYTVTMYGKTYSNTVTINVLPSATAARKPDAVVASVNPANAVTLRTTQPANEVVKATAPANTDFPNATPSALTGNRIALVIGNSAYKNVPALANPTRDADTMANSFRSAGFKTVQLRSDLTREKLTDALKDFAAEADKADWAVVYFAGHGLEVNGTNYLIPVDARLAADRDVEFEAVPLDRVMNAVSGAKRLRLVLLDACRDNPFANQMRRSVATRSVGRGLTNVEPEAGTLVVYAAKHGQVALDGDGGNSPFVTALTKRMRTPGLEVRRLFDYVRDDVLEMTSRAQQPFSYGSLPGSEDYYFRAAATANQP
jgi:Caspase domain